MKKGNKTHVIRRQVGRCVSAVGGRGRSKWAVLQLTGAVLLLAAAGAVGLVGTAGATGPSDGTIVSGVDSPVSPFTSDTPFSSGQQIDVVIPANSVFAPGAGLLVVECTDPGGGTNVPTSTSQCDGNTNSANIASWQAESTGGADFNNDTGYLYTLYATPDTGIGDTGSSPACSLTVACILYVGENQNDFTQPHFWSTPFFIAADKGDTGANPGDGSAPPAPTFPSASTSTVVASSSDAVANGKDQSEVTVTLLNSESLPVVGKTVTLGQATGNSVISSASTGSNVTNSSGQAAFDVTDLIAESVTYSATDTTDSPNVTVTQTAGVTFAAPTVSNTHSTVVASPSTVALNGSVTVTVTLRDQGAQSQPVAGKTVTLAATGSAVVTPSPTGDVTDSSGVATFTATDAEAETVTFTATDSTDTLTLTSTASATFGTLVVSASKSTVTAPSIAEVGSSGTTATVTLLTSTGSPIPGKKVTLSASPPSTVTVGAPAVTDENGQATFTVADTDAQSVTLSAVDTTDSSLAVTAQATVDFEAPAASKSTSAVSAGVSSVPADGQTEVLISVTLLDQFGQPLSGRSVSLQASPSTSVEDHPIGVGSTQPGQTNSSGVAQFEAVDTTAETVTFSATDTSDSVVLTSTAAVTFTAGGVDGGVSTVVASPAAVAQGGTSTIVVTLNDYFGNPVAGKTVVLQPLNGSSVVTTVNATTESNGQASFSVTDADAEVVTYAATDTSDGSLLLEAQGVVTFGNPPSPPPVPADSAVVTSAASVPGDGTTTATITVSLFDGDADAVAGKVVTLTPSGGNSKVTAISATTGNTGTAMFSVSDATAEAVTYTATDTTDNVALSGDPVMVTFTPVAAVTTTSTTTTTATSGSTTTSTSTTLPVAAASVATSGNSGASSSGGSSSSLAVTGAPTFLPYLIGFGIFLMGIGSLGRRLSLRRSA
jgi:Bacterial Ig-like domain (group 1)